MMVIFSIKRISDNRKIIEKFITVVFLFIGYFGIDFLFMMLLWLYFYLLDRLFPGYY